MKHCFTLIFTWLLMALGLSDTALGQVSRLATAPVSLPAEPRKSLQFIENKNQWDPSVRYMAPIPGGQLYLQAGSLVYSFADKPDPHQHGGQQPVSQVVKTHAYSVSFLGAGTPATVAGSGMTEGYRNYFTGNDPARWASQVRAFEEVQYNQLYPGIDLHLYEKNAHLKYDLLVAPHTDPRVIRMQYKGADKLALIDGDLHITTSVNEVIERRPVAYQQVQGRQKKVPCHFKLEGDLISFDFPKGYDSSLPLIIDPVLVFSTYSGSLADNWGFTATYDQEGNMYSGGIVNDAGFPVTMGAYDRIYNGGQWDIGILKYRTSASGNASLLFATYLGGNGTDIPSSLVVNSSNELLVMGATGSATFPTTVGAHDRSFHTGTNQNQTPLGGITFDQGSDLFVARLSGDGTRLLAATYLGGNRNEGILSHAVNPATNAAILPPHPLNRNYGDQFRGDIITDAANNVYLISSTQSPDFPVQGGFQSSFGGTNDAVVAKLSPDLALTWSSYLGGTGADAGYSIQLDSDQNIFIAGGTTSAGLPGTAGAFRATYGGGQVNNIPAADGFVAKLSNNGTALQRLSYIGTNHYDNVFFVQLDESNNVFLLGQTLGTYPVTAGTYSTPKGKQFIQKLNNDLTTGLMSTVFGSTNSIEADFLNITPTAFLVDNCNRIYVCGWGGNTNNRNGFTNGTTSGLPVTADAAKKTTDGNDFYLMMLSRDAGALEYATFFGGNAGSGDHVDGGTSRFDKRGFVYQAVCAACGQAGSSSGFPTTPGAWSSTNNGITKGEVRCNNAAFKFDFNVVTAVAGSNQTVCANQAGFQLTGFSPVTGGTWSGEGVSPTGIFTPSAGLVGTVTLTYTVANGSCISTSTKTITVNPAAPVSFTGLPPQLCLPQATPLTLLPSVAGGTFSGPGMRGNTFDPAAAGNGTHTITFSYTNSFGCTVTSSQTVRINTLAPVVAGPDERICSGSYPLMLTGFSPAGGTWSGTGVNANGLFTPSEAIAGTHVLSYTVSNGFCSITQTKTVIVDPTIRFTQGPALSLCPDGPAQAITDITPPGGSWTGNGVSPGGLFTPTAGLAGTHLLTYFVQVGACSGISTKEVSVSAPAVINAAAVPTECGSPTSIQGFAPFTATFTNATTGATAYLWEFGDGGTSTEATPSHQYSKDGNYEVYLTAFYGNGCRVKQKIAVARVDKKEMVPNVFTPNGDGKNDTFVPRITCLPTDLKIYNRWGKLVYEQKNYQNDWGGQQVSDGIYYYQLTSSKGQVWKGWVEIVR